jgi:periplasmic protein CpxP/Spy
MRAKFLLVITLFVFGITAVNAQKQNADKPRPTPLQVAYNQTEWMKTELKLDDKQKTDVSNINLKYAKLRDQIFQANKGNKEVIQPKMKELNSQKNAELKKVLTADQFTQLVKIEKQRAEEQKKKIEQKNQKK